MVEADGAPAPFVEPERRFRNLQSSLTTAIDLDRYIFVGPIPRGISYAYAGGNRTCSDYCDPDAELY